MSLTTLPWWAMVPVSVIIPLAITLAVLMWWDKRRWARERLADRAEYLAQERARFAYEMTSAGNRLLSLPVWPREVVGPMEPTDRLVEAIKGSAECYALLSAAPAAVLARTAASRAADLASVIKEVRTTTLRGAHGTMEEPANERHQRASRAFEDALDQLATTSDHYPSRS